MRITFQYEHKYEPDIETHIKCITRTLVIITQSLACKEGKGGY